MSENDSQDPSMHYCREVKISYGRKKKADPISCAASAHRLAKKIIDPNADREHFAAIYLDAKNVPLAWRVIAIGTLSGCLVHPREVFRPGLIVGAAAIVVLHNHPSGELTPSAEDLKVTQRLDAAGALLGIRVLDHLILGSTGFYSFAERGHLNPGKAVSLDDERISA